jgi:hemerythrin-like metal-binding protein
MSTLEWSEALALELPAMDDTHREFVELLAAVEGADDARLRATWDALTTHTEAHFGQEDRWMHDTGFSSSNCHTTQHLVVLQVMREGVRRGATGQLDVIRQMAHELAGWFPQHAQSMDAALALHLRSVGFDFAAGGATLPQALPTDAIQGCGSGACSPSPIPAARSPEPAAG